MTTGTTHNRLGRRWWLTALSILACFALAACGPLGDDDPDPTATAESIAQPTDETLVDETEVATEPESAGLTIATPMVTPVAMEGTPDLEPVEESTSAGAPDSTPIFNDVNSTASPVAVPDATPLAETPAASGVDQPLPDGDGTSGAMPATDAAPTETPLLVAETPAVQVDGTPVASPAALAGSLAELEVGVVASCELESVPPIALESAAFVTVSDVNIRFGPGADCDPIAISPIGAFIPVIVIGGPVQREGEDLVWVQVEVAGEIGWIVTDALEPANS
jgi:hypothetical protein